MTVSHESFSSRGRTYRAYGLTLRSSLPLPELIPTDAAPDVIIRRGRVGRSIGRGNAYLSLNDQETFLTRKNVARFRIRRGNEIVVDPAPKVDEEELRLFLLGPALAILLHQRGRLVLHASAVAIRGAAVAFMGDAAWGKSTIAAALHTRGYPLVVDDVLAVQSDSRCPTVFPGYPQLKLWPDAAAALDYSPDRLARITARLEKRQVRAHRKFSPRAIPIRRVYVLAEGKDQGIEIIRPANGLVELVRHSYLVRLLHRRQTKSHFLQCASLACRVSLRRLRVRWSLATLPDVARMLERDMSRLARWGHPLRSSG